MKSNLTILAVLFTLAAAGAPSGEPKPWCFARSDWAALRSAGHDFTMAPDSAWLPARYARALLETLRFAMSSGPGAPACEELSFSDFFHGHVVCRRPGSPRLESLIRQFQDGARELESRAMGEEVYEVRRETMGAYTLAVETIKRRATALVATVEAEKLCPRPAMVFHTVEHTIPNGMDYGDPRRNLITWLDTMKPAMFEPSSRGSASSFHTDFDELFQVIFLVDRAGAVHAAAGTERTLSPVLGRPYAQGDWRR